MPPPFTSFEATGFPSEILREVLSYFYPFWYFFSVQYCWPLAAVSNPECFVKSYVIAGGPMLSFRLMLILLPSVLFVAGAIFAPGRS